MVKTERAPSGIIAKVVENSVLKDNSSIIVARTRNDRVVDIICSLSDEVVPLDRPAQEEEKELLHQMGLLASFFDRSSLIIKGHYGGPMINSPERKRSVNKKITHLTDQLDYEAGDALLVVGYKNHI